MIHAKSLKITEIEVDDEADGEEIDGEEDAVTMAEEPACFAGCIQGLQDLTVSERDNAKSDMSMREALTFATLSGLLQETQD